MMKRILSLMLVLACITGLLPPAQAVGVLPRQTDSDSSVEPEPAPVTYTVTAHLEHLTLEGAEQAVQGEDYRAVLSPEEDYLLPETVELTVGGEPCEEFSYDKESGELMIPGAQITGDVELTAAGVQKVYEVTLVQTEGGTITADRTSAPRGERVALTAQPLEGYLWKGWETTPALEIDEENTFLMPGEAVTVSGLFEMIPAPVTYTVTAHLEHLTLEGAEQAVQGEDYRAVLSPEEDYLLPEKVVLTVGGEPCEEFSYDKETGELMIPGAQITGEVALTAAGVQKVYEVTLVQTQGGTITADRTSAPRGERVTLTAQPLEGYLWKGWETTPALEIDEENTFLMPGEAVTVSGLFEMIPAPAPEQLTIVQPPHKTIYIEGERFDPAGMVVLARYSDGEQREVEVTFSREALRADQTELVLSYTDRGRTVEAAQPIRVQKPLPLEMDTIEHEDGSVTDTVSRVDGTVVKTTYFPEGPMIQLEVLLSDWAVQGVDPILLPIDPVDMGNCPVFHVKHSAREKVVIQIPVEQTSGSTVALRITDVGEGEEIVRKAAVTAHSVILPVGNSEKLCLENRVREFDDVKPGDWFRMAVDFTTSRGLFAGVSETSFGPALPMTRGMLAQVLHTLNDNPRALTHREFPDVSAQIWYAGAVAWAAEEGIISGYPDGRFGGEDPISREQLALMLYNTAGKPAVTLEQLDFVDAEKVSDYARTAVRWAVEHGVMAGDNMKHLNPQGKASRAEVAAMLRSFVNDLYR